MPLSYQTVSTPDLFYILILLSGAVLGLTISLRMIVKYGLTAFAVRPIVPFALLFSLIHFILPILKLVENVYRYQNGYQTDTKILVSLLSLTLLLFAWLLGSSQQFSPLPKSSMGNVPRVINGQRFIIVGVVIYLTGLFFAAQDVYIILNKIGYANFLLDTHTASEHRSSLRIFSNFMILGSALILSCLISRARRDRFMYMKIMALVTPLIAYAIILNSRNMLFITSLTLATVYLGFFKDFSDIRKNQNKKLLIRKSSLYKFFLFLVVGAFLYLVFISMTNHRYSVSDSEYMSERREHVLIYSLDGAFGNDENLLWLMENNNDLLYGKTYLSGLLVIIPRQIWASKPHGAGPYLINMIAPGSYVEGQSGNNSLTTGLLTEALMNFGVFGMFLGVLVWAYLSSRFIRAFYMSNNILYRTGFLVCGLLVSTSFIYQEFLGFFGRSLVLVTPLFIIGFLIGGSKLSVKRSEGNL